MTKKDKLQKVQIDKYAQQQLSILKSLSAAHKIKLPGRLLHLCVWIGLTCTGIFLVLR